MTLISSGGFLPLDNLNEIIKSNKFPNGVNIEIYQLINSNYIKARVYERGVGETDACGSGALCLFNYLKRFYHSADAPLSKFIIYKTGGCQNTVAIRTGTSKDYFTIL